MNRYFFFAIVSLSLVGTTSPQAALSDEQTAIENIRKHGGTVRSVAANDSSKEMSFEMTF